MFFCYSWYLLLVNCSFRFKFTVDGQTSITLHMYLLLILLLIFPPIAHANDTYDDDDDEAVVNNALIIV